MATKSGLIKPELIQGFSAICPKCSEKFTGQYEKMVKNQLDIHLVHCKGVA